MTPSRAHDKADQLTIIELSLLWYSDMFYSTQTVTVHANRGVVWTLAPRRDLMSSGCYLVFGALNSAKEIDTTEWGLGPRI